MAGETVWVTPFTSVFGGVVILVVSTTSFAVVDDIISIAAITRLYYVIIRISGFRAFSTIAYKWETKGQAIGQFLGY
jgi:uncharacterized membrane protein YuzA (DUF378 family)